LSSDPETFIKPLMSGSEPIMPRDFVIVKRYVVVFKQHYIFLETTHGHFWAWGGGFQDL
jgi:hypothetical protein